MRRLLPLLALLAPLPAAAQAVTEVCGGAVILADETRTVTDAAGEVTREWRVLLMLMPQSPPQVVTLTFRPPPGASTNGPQRRQLRPGAPMAPGVILGLQPLGRGTFPPKPPGGLSGLLGIACAPG